jgi:hypothetical protein
MIFGLLLCSVIVAAAGSTDRPMEEQLRNSSGIVPGTNVIVNIKVKLNASPVKSHTHGCGVLSLFKYDKNKN